ncbi:MAG TPA: hypothetical protein VMU34_06915 [Mycobacterium sp.]|nr:hypothetical protein [Mycobacterium sp.]
MRHADQAAGNDTRSFIQFRHDQTGLRGKRLRLLTDDPTDDAGAPSNLPAGITEVVSTEDQVGPNLSVRVHPLNEPNRIAYVAFDQLAIYEE